MVKETERDTYRGTSLMRNRPPLGPYRRPMPRALAVLGVLMSEIWLS